jgi:toxin-antitoxin system PIN domain toxin
LYVVDVNVLLYATDADSAHHEPARAWLDDAFSGREAIGFAWVVLLGFLRLITQARLVARPLTADEAADSVEHWLQQPVATVVHPTTRHLSIVRGLLTSVGTAGNLVNDAHLAALAVEHGAEIVSFDRDFGRFEGVRSRLPG